MQRSIDPNSRRTGLHLLDLGFASGFVLWAFRAGAAGHMCCPPVVNGFTRALGPDANSIRFSCLSLIAALSEHADRTLHLASSGCFGVTYDEVCLLATLDAAQNNFLDQRNNQLTWLLGRSAPLRVGRMAQTFAQKLIEQDLLIKTPDLGRAGHHQSQTDVLHRSKPKQTRRYKEDAHVHTLY